MEGGLTQGIWCEPAQFLLCPLRRESSAPARFVWESTESFSNKEEEIMIGHLSPKERNHSSSASRAPSPPSLATRALKASGVRATLPLPPPGSREDFLCALELLGARLVPRGGSSEERPRTWAAHLSCPYRTWVRVFGPPQDVQWSHKGGNRVPLCAWTHEYAGRSLTCVGHLFERSPGKRWVLLARLGF